MSGKNLLVGIIASGLCAIVSVVDAEAAEKQTRLRASTPKGTFRSHNGATRLTTVTLQVKNVGEERATGVAVQITLPDGSNKQAFGPTEIEPKAEASYELYSGEYVTSSKTLKASVSCKNCYR